MLRPVPPYCGAILVPCHVPEVIVPPLTVSPLIVPDVVKLPELSITNLVTPEADAVKRSPEFVLLIIAAAFEPYPEFTNNGACGLFDPIPKRLLALSQ